MDVLVKQEVALVFSTAWKLRPLDQGLESLTIFFDGKPNTNKD